MRDGNGASVPLLSRHTTDVGRCHRANRSQTKRNACVRGGVKLSVTIRIADEASFSRGGHHFPQMFPDRASRCSRGPKTTTAKPRPWSLRCTSDSAGGMATPGVDALGCTSASPTVEGMHRIVSRRVPLHHKFIAGAALQYYCSHDGTSHRSMHTVHRKQLPCRLGKLLRITPLV